MTSSSNDRRPEVARAEQDAELEYLRRTSADLARSLEEMASLRAVFRRILAATNRRHIGEALLEAAAQLLGPRPAAIWTYREEEEDYALLVGSEELLPEREVAEWAFGQERPTTVPHGEGFVTIVPLTVLGRRAGMLVVDTSTLGEEITSSHHELLAEVAGIAAVALSNADLLGRIERQMHLLSNVLDSITNGIVVMDPEGRVRRMNRNAMAMLESDLQAAAAPFREVLPAEIASVMGELLAELAQSGFAMERMVMRRLQSGTDLPLAVSVAPLLGQQGRPEGTIFILRDMTASRELERLRRLDQMKSEFVANVSHELKTPLTSIRAYTEALLDMADVVKQRGEPELAESGGTMREFLGVVLEEADRLLGLINDLLNVARIQAGRLRLQLEKLDPRTIVTEILKLSKVQSDKHVIGLELADGLPEMVMDKEKMKEVMINLVSNAIKYSPNGGKVGIRMHVVENNLRIQVEDQGIGIAPEHLDKIFEQFYRVDNSLTYEVSGTGLGLAIVKAIVDAHGGKIEVHSEVGKGSVFTVWLPVRTELPRGEIDESFVD